MSIIKDLLFATMGANSEKNKGDFTGEFFEENQKELQNGQTQGNGSGSGSGVSSWSDLGESPTGGDTLTANWDEIDLDSEDLVFVQETNGLLYVKVSDATPSADDFANGCVIITVNGENSITGEQIAELTAGSGAICVSGGFYVAPSDGLLVEEVGLTFSEKGVYLCANPDYRASSLTIPGYTGFPSVNKVPEKYLPEQITYGTEDMEAGTSELATGTLYFVYE